MASSVLEISAFGSAVARDGTETSPTAVSAPAVMICRRARLGTAEVGADVSAVFISHPPMLNFPGSLQYATKVPLSTSLRPGRRVDGTAGMIGGAPLKFPLHQQLMGKVPGKRAVA